MYRVILVDKKGNLETFEHLTRVTVSRTTVSLYNAEAEEDFYFIPVKEFNMNDYNEVFIKKE